jgi:hypothetical protein
VVDGFDPGHPKAPSARDAVLHATRDAGTIDRTAKHDLGKAAALLTRDLEAHPDARYRSTLVTLAGRKVIQVAAAQAELRSLNGQEAHLRHGALNRVSGFILGIFSSRGSRLDSAVARANADFSRDLRHNQLTPNEDQRLEKDILSAEKDATGYQHFRDRIGSDVATVTSVVAGVAATVATGGAAAPVLASVAAGLAAAGTTVATKAALEGDDYTLKDALIDAALTGATRGAAGWAILSSGVGSTLLESVGAGALESQSLSTAVNSSLSASLQGVLSSTIRPSVWKHGVGEGLIAIAKAVGAKGASGAAAGALAG